MEGGQGGEGWLGGGYGIGSPQVMLLGLGIHNAQIMELKSITPRITRGGFPRVSNKAELPLRWEANLLQPFCASSRFISFVVALSFKSSLN